MTFRYEDIAGDFYHNQTTRVNFVRRWFHLGRYERAHDLVRARLDADGRMLDLGCGSGDWNRSGLPVTGLDVNEALLQHGQRRGTLRDYKLGSAEAIPFADNAFDLVSAFEFLEHAEHYDQILREAFRVLKPGGQLVVSVPDERWTSLWRPLFGLQVLWQGYVKGDDYYKAACGHINHFVPATIRAAAERAGFAVELCFSLRKLTLFLVARKPGEAEVTAFPAPELTVLIPTLNEADSIGPLLTELQQGYPDARLLVVDDGSTDGTQAAVSGLPGVELLDRSAEPVKGLTASILAAATQVDTPYWVVIDADGQHPTPTIGEILRCLRAGDDWVIASRAEVEQGWDALRQLISGLGLWIGRLALWLRGKGWLSADVLSGYFGVRTAVWQRHAGSGRGFQPTGYKVLFDWLKQAPTTLKQGEVFYRFRTRKADASKINLRVYWQFLKACLGR